MRLTVLVGEETWQHRPVYYEIVRRAHAAGLAGATVLRAIEGYGTTLKVHSTRLLSLVDGLGFVVLIVDREDRIRDFLPRLDGLIHHGLVTLDRLEVVVPARRGEQSRPRLFGHRR
ncbi:DUF190 domain-containing protein [Solihabitans fulvus]|uniref:DUF190 domain-containing protein n=1 Tax=Solihabitans fulvus TaxID=1892852 RepID=A0A5B2WM20_9PSEU|nr:DUF190 domain-containing protein [Solihabitans fulvus]KAA2252831.1 DUF190 domain-containing protein [Solihabitans fulvus]